MGPAIRRMIPSTYQPFDRSTVAPCKLPSLPIHLQQQLLHVQNLLGGGADLCIGVGLRMRNIGCALELRKNTEDLHKKY